MLYDTKVFFQKSFNLFHWLKKMYHMFRELSLHSQNIAYVTLLIYQL